MHQAEYSRSILRCMSLKTCHFINHGFVSGRCRTELSQCQALTPITEVMVNGFGPLLHWRFGNYTKDPDINQLTIGLSHTCCKEVKRFLWEKSTPVPDDFGHTRKATG